MRLILIKGSIDSSNRTLLDSARYIFGDIFIRRQRRFKGPAEFSDNSTKRRIIGVQDRHEHVVLFHCLEPPFSQRDWSADFPPPSRSTRFCARRRQKILTLRVDTSTESYSATGLGSQHLRIHAFAVQNFAVLFALFHQEVLNWRTTARQSYGRK